MWLTSSSGTLIARLCKSYASGDSSAFLTRPLSFLLCHAVTPSCIIMLLYLLSSFFSSPDCCLGCHLSRLCSLCSRAHALPLKPFAPAWFSNFTINCGLEWGRCGRGRALGRGSLSLAFLRPMPKHGQPSLNFVMVDCLHQLISHGGCRTL